MFPSIDVEVQDCAPTSDLDEWDHILECGIEVPSGRLVIAGCTDYFPDSARLILAPGKYRARIHYGALESISDDGLDGDDHYKVVLWPSEDQATRVIKQRPSS